MTCTRDYNERVHLWSYIDSDVDANFPNNLKSQKSKGTNNTERASSLGRLIESDVCNLSCVGKMICSSSRYPSKGYSLGKAHVTFTIRNHVESFE